MAAFLEKSTGSEGFHQVIDFLSQSHISYALTKKPEVYVSFIKQFWRIAEASTDTDGEVTITAIIDGQSKTITEASLRRHLKLEDHDGVTFLPNSEIFEQLALMGYHTFNKIDYSKDMQKKQLKTHTSTYHVPSLNNKVFSNMRRLTKGYSEVEVGLFPTMLTIPAAASSPTPESSPVPSSSPSRITSSPSLSSEPSIEPTSEPQPSPDAEYHVPSPHESPLHVVHSHGSDEGSLKLLELTNLVTKLSERIEVLEEDLRKTKTTYSAAFTRLILKVKKLETKVQLGKARKRARVVLSEEEKDDSSKQGRINEDQNVYFAQDEEVVHDTAEEEQHEVSTAGIHVSTAHVSTTGIHVSTAPISTAGEETKKDKGKAIMTKPEPKKKSKKLLEQERLGLEEAIRLQTQVDEEERAQIARDEEIARQLLALDEERITSEPKTTKDIDWNHPSVQRYWDLKNQPKSEAQARKNMIVYLKNQGNYKIKDFDGMSYDEIRPIFEKVWDFNHHFVSMDLEMEKEKRVKGKSQKKPAEIEEIEVEQVEKDTSKKSTRKRKKSLPRIRTGSSTKKQKVEQDAEKEELKEYLDIIPREDVAVDVESLSTKYPIVDWKTYTISETFMYYKIIRGDGSSKNYKILSEMLYDFDRHDVVDLYRLVKERYSSSKPEGYDLMLWGDLHTLFEPDEESEIWMNQNEYNLISWSLCDFCGVHILLMQNGIAIHMLTEKKYPLS
ncbi:hypothetical protein Tco_1054719 [Tanacetum coccineum]|uniref:Xylulose kinase-1 n=1 Tax=Tanacetum coccineum TaxID=301880 RepID=A0ABQ5GZN3_9ASTR